MPADGQLNRWRLSTRWKKSGDMEQGVKSGYVAIVGRPNVGKSTLLNQLIGEKISIVSRKAQTTRHRILGVLTEAKVQYVFVDTPGFQTEHTNALNRAMNRSVTRALADVDTVIFMVEAKQFDSRDKAVVRLLPENALVILVVNKIDLVNDKAQLLPRLSEFSEHYPFVAVVPLSAERDKKFDGLLSEVAKHLPCQEFIFGEEEITDRSERFIVAEYIREKLFRLTGDELPYSTAVEIEKFELDGALRRIYAAIIVDRDSQKGMVIGKGGKALKRIATEARQDMERLFDGKVYLEIFVKVKSGWSDDERLLKTLGYE